MPGRTAPAPTTAPRTLETVSVPGVEILATGVWNGDEYSRDDLAEMVSAFKAGNAGIDPPVKLGHNPDQPLLARDGYPAAGYVQTLRLRGDKLVADLRDVPKRIAALIKAKGYSKISSEVYFNLKDGTKRLPRVLKAVSLLGADVPAVTSIADIEALYGADRATIVAQYTTHPDQEHTGADVHVYLLPPDMSYDALREALGDALRDRFPQPLGGLGAWVVDFYDDAVIVGTAPGETYRIPYSVDPAGEVTLAPEIVPVRRVTSWQPEGAEPAADAGAGVAMSAAVYGDAGAGGEEDFAQTLRTFLERLDGQMKGTRGMPRIRTFVHETIGRLEALAAAGAATDPPAPARPAPTPASARGISLLDQAIALHQRHMDGAAPTTGPAGVKSQQRLMDLMVAARAALAGTAPPTPGKAKEKAMTADLTRLLGLADDADETVVLAAVQALRERADTPAPSQYSADEFRALSDRVGQLTTELATRDAHGAVEDAIRAGKVLPAMRDWAQGYALRDSDGFKAYVAATPTFPFGEKGATGSQGGDTPGGGLSESERAVAKQLGMDEGKVREFKAKELARV